jgi:hypothetical protein
MCRVRVWAERPELILRGASGGSWGENQQYSRPPFLPNRPPRKPAGGVVRPVGPRTDDPSGSYTGSIVVGTRLHECPAYLRLRGEIRGAVGAQYGGQGRPPHPSSAGDSTPQMTGRDACPTRAAMALPGAAGLRARQSSETANGTQWRALRGMRLRSATTRLPEHTRAGE